MKEELKKIQKEILSKIKEIKNQTELKDLESEYLGRKGKLTLILKKIKDLSEVEKKEIGQFANTIKKEVIAEINKIKKTDHSGNDLEEEYDVTLPGKKISSGHLHPITLVMNELEDIFASLGFMALDGPELESDYYCFESLNIPAHHPARDMQDTFYIDPSYAKASEGKPKKDFKQGELDLVMRTHTSPVQVRAMQKYGAPLKCIVPGRVFRSEATDACHDSTFYQLEGLMIDKNISIVNLMSVMKEVFTAVFKQEVEIRVRPGYFPFVEPGLEVDIKCTICNGSGCASCKHSGWLEMVGAGMVHPNVLEAGKIDPKKYSGFAFGIGLDRLVMMRYGINNIRLFHSGDLRFLSQF